MAQEGVLTKIADAVYDIISTETWDVEIDVERTLPPFRKVWELRKPHVAVIPRLADRLLDSRLEVKREFQVDVVISVAVDHLKEVDADPLARVAEEIGAYFEDNREILSSPRCMWTRTDHAGVKPQDNLRWRVMGTVMTLNYVMFE